ncbi:M4 family metallopeptidase [Cumulibacter manganitolerans]|uniref:M4 family metallopeptidase n=1 Tax=Cumulibacter manganitolerans TaxID=1884992 RepID=UPI00129631D4|nr:M4 family metallopeptidase [Cumulibacter manganitolerans]
MNTTPAPHVCGIIPPHILRRLAESDDERVVRAAQRTLAIGIEVIGRREVRGARADRRGLPRTAGLVPPDLQERAQRRVSPERPRAGGEPATATRPPATPRRSVYDALQKTDLPGHLVRAEGAAPSGDESADEAYDGLGATWRLFHDVYGRDSLDGRGLPLIASVHFDRDFDNAYWDGEQMVFGDGDGVYFQSFTNSVDVIGHELTHGFTQYTAGFTYVGQSGALNESLSDCFGSMVKQRVLRQQADDADWLIGEGLFTAKVHGVALRSMKAPGTAYDDPHLGKDPQPASMSGYADLPHDEAHDNGGVHINSGIPNRAFYLAATAIGGSSWEGAGPIWYHAVLEGGLPKDADFARFASATLTAAQTLHGAESAQYRAVEKAWREVEVDVTPSPA